ncbi:unnamed protein product [Adineta ricciae]|nr:unnamed protein product [Adineta ricciae]
MMTQEPLPAIYPRPYTSNHRLSVGVPQFSNVFAEPIKHDKLPRQTYDRTKRIRFLPPFLALILRSTYFLVALCIVLVIPILQLVFGIVYLDQCPINVYIPIYLIVTGACGIAAIGLTMVIVIAFVCCIKQDSIAGSCISGCVIGAVVFFIFIMSFFLFGWFIAGNVWVFGAKTTVNFEKENSPYYCHKTLYEFAFWIIIVTYILMVVSCCVSCCRACFQSLTTLKA